MRTVYIGGTKGGSGKTTTAHLLALGAILNKQPASYVLTDPLRSLKGEGRPYSVQDGRNPERLANFIANADTIHNGWLFIDGGGNRPAFDQATAAEVELTIVPFKPNEEDLETVAADLRNIPNAFALPTAWSTNPKAQKAAEYLLASLSTAFPGRVIETPIYFVNSTADLLGAVLGDPSTPLRNAARRAYAAVDDAYERHMQAQGQEEAAA